MGTSGWSYEEWVGILYPASSTPKLKYYSSIFDTVEVDSSFYSMPSPKLVLGWIKNTPRDFKFSIKMPKTITHELKLELNAGRMEQFLNLLPTDEIKFSVEFRNKTWLNDYTWNLLKRKKVAYTIVDEPLLPNDLISTADHVYIRWHGHGKSVWYDYRYSQTQIEEWAGRMKNLKG